MFIPQRYFRAKVRYLWLRPGSLYVPRRRGPGVDVRQNDFIKTYRWCRDDMLYLYTWQCLHVSIRVSWVMKYVRTVRTERPTFRPNTPTMYLNKWSTAFYAPKSIEIRSRNDEFSFLIYIQSVRLFLQWPYERQ